MVPSLTRSLSVSSHALRPLRYLGRECTPSPPPFARFLSFWCPHLSPLCSSASECPSLSRFLCVLTSSSLRALQKVSPLRSLFLISLPHPFLTLYSLERECHLTHSLAFFPCPHFFVPMRSAASECPLLVRFLPCLHVSLPPPSW